MNHPASDIRALEPHAVWRAFADLCQVPRPSKHEAAAIRHVETWAEQHGWPHRRDAVGNVVVTVPARGAADGAPIVVLQAHLDMVCEQDAGTDHDFHRDPIRPWIDDDGWVRADGTTLGADNGLGVALMMAAAEADFPRPPLELLFTVDEETGLTGASALDPALVTGRLLINLDCEDDAYVIVGCAGAAGGTLRLPIARAAAFADVAPMTLRISGLRGGHSGVDIHRGRGNALHLLAEALRALVEVHPQVAVTGFSGGGQGNAIPREAEAHLLLPPTAAVAVTERLQAVETAIRARLGDADPGVRLRLDVAPNDHPPPFTETTRTHLLDLIAALPQGAITYSPALAELVETSYNLAVATDDGEVITLVAGCRSSDNAALAEAEARLRALAADHGASIEAARSYPGWAPTPDAPIVQRTIDVYGRLFDDAPTVTAVHAGLECGVLADRLPGLEAVSIGPTIRDPHSPDERASIASVALIWRWLEALLADLAAAPSA
ncbi:MAG: beta-Ala-His dipeptidase [Acidobacteriota bacterium]